jgi:hypothetical protein
MRYQEKIYIQNPSTVIRNKIINIVNMSSDMCEFFQPSFVMTGATKIMTGTTVTDHNIHIIDSGTTFDLTFSFTGNVDTFIDTDTTFKYNVYPYNDNTNVFTSPPIFESGDIEWTSFSGSSGFTDTLLVSEFIVDGEYLVKGSYEFTDCTAYLNALGYTNDTTLPLVGSEYGIYNPEFDNYFALIAQATKPEFTLTTTTTGLGELTVESTLVVDETEIVTDNIWLGSPIVALNGLTLAEGETEDFTTVGDNTIFFNTPLVAADVVTVSYVTAGNPNGLVSEALLITDPIASGATDGEGANQYYYNTGTTKFEIYMLSEPVEFNDVIVTLNGVTLAITLDYSQSLVNPLRIILNGVILDGDVMTITYNSFGSFVGDVYTPIFDLFWTVTPAPLNDSGLFTALFGDDDTFATIVYSAATPYIANETTYSVNVDLSSYSGTSLFYKVVNEKNYTIISGDIITTITDSDIIPITLNL